MKRLIYTGVGSRKVPQEILEIITKISKKLASLNYVLRSGGALGCDHAFETGAEKRKIIFYMKDATQEAMAISKKYHPAWNKCSEIAKQLHGRNAFQVLGDDLKTPSDFLICYTKDGCKSHKTRTILTGGTGTAISIADAYKVKIFNLGNKEDYKRLTNFIK